jgi:hypothetical protein
MCHKRPGRGSALVIVIAALSMSCASNAARSRASQTGDASNNLLTAAEMIRVAPDQSLWTAIERARPWFLQGRGSVATVSIDGSAGMELSVLRTIPVTDVQEVRLQRGVGNGGRSAVLPNGDVVVGDMIIVLTRRR